MKKNTISGITPYTDAEWPVDHPLRRHAPTILTNRFLDKFDVKEIALVCGKPGEERMPCPDGDSDVPCKCFRCGCDLLRRTSANAAWQAVCFGCWEIIS